MEIIKTDKKLRKTERLTKEKPIQLLFERGNGMFVYPFKVIWQEIETCEFPAKVMFVVPKKKFKTAVKRNHLRRLMKESYRTNKSIFYKSLENLGSHVYLSLIYLGKDDADSKIMIPSLLKIFKKLSAEIINSRKQDIS